MPAASGPLDMSQPGFDKRRGIDDLVGSDGAAAGELLLCHAKLVSPCKFPGLMDNRPKVFIGR